MGDAQPFAWYLIGPNSIEFRAGRYPPIDRPPTDNWQPLYQTSPAERNAGMSSVMDQYGKRHYAACQALKPCNCRELSHQYALGGL